MVKKIVAELKLRLESSLTLKWTEEVTVTLDSWASTGTKLAKLKEQEIDRAMEIEAAFPATNF